MHKYSVSDYYYFAEAYVFLCIGKFMVKMVPFRKIIKYLSANGNQELKDPIAHFPLKVAVAVRRASRYTFFRSVCYDQAIAAKLMLKMRKIPSTLYFGTAKDNDGKLIAHAWLKCSEIIVTGEKGMDRFTVIGAFSD